MEKRWEKKAKWRQLENEKNSLGVRFGEKEKEVMRGSVEVLKDCVTEEIRIRTKRKRTRNKCNCCEKRKTEMC